MSIFVNDEHPKNAFLPIDLTEEGIDISTKFEQFWKTPSLIDVNGEGSLNFTIFKFVHESKRYDLSIVTYEGISIYAIFLLCAIEFAPTLILELNNSNSNISLYLLSYADFIKSIFKKNKWFLNDMKY